MYEIQFRGKGGCQRAAFVELLLKQMGAKRLWNPRDDLRIIFDSQEDFKSLIHHVDYELPPSPEVKKEYPFLNKRIFVTFRYNNFEDTAAMQFDGANKLYIESRVNELGLTQQTTPNELKERVEKFAELAKASDPSQPIEVVEVNAAK